MWHQIFISELNQAQVEALEPLLMELGALSVTCEDSFDQPILEPLPGDAPLWKTSNLVALFDDKAVCEQVESQLSQPELGFNIRYEQLKDEVWELAWQKGYKPMQFGERLWVCPSNMSPPNPGAINVMMNPGLAFGTGTHATTALCLKYLDAMSLQQKTVVDYGCGSGILAISAIKLGAQAAYCTDIDPQAIESTLENARRNNLPSGTLSAELVSTFSCPQVDIVLANILAKPLIELAPTLSDSVKPGGIIILSGILERQSASVESAFEKHGVLVQKESLDGWVGLLFKTKD